MDFSETEDQVMIRDMVRDFAETVASPTCHQRDKEQKPPIDEFKQFAELGVAGMTIPEAYGGQKLDDISEEAGTKLKYESAKTITGKDPVTVAEPATTPDAVTFVTLKLSVNNLVVALPQKNNPPNKCKLCNAVKR